MGSPPGAGQCPRRVSLYGTVRCTFPYYDTELLSNSPEAVAGHNDVSTTAALDGLENLDTKLLLRALEGNGEHISLMNHEVGTPNLRVAGLEVIQGNVELLRDISNGVAVDDGVPRRLGRWFFDGFCFDGRLGVGAVSVLAHPVSGWRIPADDIGRAVRGLGGGEGDLCSRRPDALVAE